MLEHIFQNIYNIVWVDVDAKEDGDACSARATKLAHMQIGMFHDVKLIKR